MPLTSKNDGPDLQVGDLVRMPWVVVRIFPAPVDVAVVARSGPDGSTAVLPDGGAMRLAVRASALGGAAVGDECLLFWRVAQVYAETGSVLVERDGVDRAHERLTPVTLRAGALAADLEYVPPAETQLASRPPRRFQLTAPAVTLDPDMLPYGYEPVDPAGAPPVPEPELPVLTSLSPHEAMLGTPSFTLHVFGTGFDDSAVIIWNGAPEPTAVVSPTEVTTLVNMETAEVALTLGVEVMTDAGLSNVLSFTFLPAAPEADPVPGDPPSCGAP